jgi:poly-gamma-glutamate synthesis protein (capsule biosynthesis protein)
MFSILIILAIFLCSCSSGQPPSLSTETPLPEQDQGQSVPIILLPTNALPEQQENGGSLSGRVVDMNGEPIEGANITAQTGSTLSDADGWFQLPSEGHPLWVTVSHTGFISRTRATAPGLPVLFRLTPDDGKTIVIHFAGDTMFGRGFFDPNGDGDPSDGLLPIEPTIQNHLDLLAPIQPLLENADLTLLNLESPFADPPYFSPGDTRPTAYRSTTGDVIVSHPNAAVAMKESGVDIVGLGNSHMYDLLEGGVTNTISALDQAGLLHFGAGTNEATAWAPAIVSAKGQTIAFVGCTTIWHTSSSSSIFVASDALQKGGAASCENVKLTEAIQEGKRRANIVVVVIHGGYEFSRTPSPRVDFFTQLARDAGATLVINYRSRVAGGFSWDTQLLVARSLGSFAFDNTVWPTFESYMLTVYLREGKVIRAYVEPLIIEDYVAHGLTGELADYVARGAAGRETGPFVVENGAMEVDIDQHAILKSVVVASDGGSRPGTIIPVPQEQWISNFTGNGTLTLGRDLLWIGGFENFDVDNKNGKPPLWEWNTDNIKAGKEYAYEGQAGIRLLRGSSNISDAVTTHLHRLLVVPNAKVSITGMIRLSPGANALLQISWYQNTSGSSSSRVTEPIPIQSYDQWQSFRLDVQVPSNIVAASIFLRLSPPAEGIVAADFDNLRAIEWAPPNSAYSPLYNFALLTGSGELTFSQQVLPGADAWFTIP